MDLPESGMGALTGSILLRIMERWRAVLNAVMSFRVPKNAGNFFTSRKPISFSRRILLNGVSRYRITVILKIFVQLESFLAEL